MATFGSNLIFKVFYDAVLCVCTFLPYIIVTFNATPYRRGFFCNDESIRYPIKPETISSDELYWVSIILILVIIIATEYYRLPSMVRAQQAFQQYLLTSYHVLVLFAFGVMATMSITIISKYTIGRLRPFFLASCRPNVTCEGRSPVEYIEDYVCENEFQDQRMSFFSGHSSWSAFCAVFITMYLQNRLRSPKLVLLRSLLQSLAFYLAFYTAFTRISDYVHHPSDVAVGLTVGALTAYAIVKWTADDFKLNTWGCLTQRLNAEENTFLTENNRSSYEAIGSEERDQ